MLDLLTPKNGIFSREMIKSSKSGQINGVDTAFSVIQIAPSIDQITDFADDLL